MKFAIKPLFHLLSSLLTFTLLTRSSAFAAACCGGGLAAPAFIVGDDKGQVSASYFYSQITDDIGTDHYWRSREELETSETLRLEAAHILTDRWQAGVSVPLVRRAKLGEQSTGFGDTAATLGYEYLPDWNHSPWRPKGLGFLQVTLPTGRSPDDSSTLYQLEARGRGFWALGVGTLLTKTRGRWDGLVNFEWHRSFDKKYRRLHSEGTIKPGWGGTWGIGGGYSLSSWRLGAALTWLYEDPVQVAGPEATSGQPQRLATATLTVSYSFQQEWSTSLSYLDQTLFGDPFNTSLSRGALLSFQKRWQR